ncbi:MAG: ABC transporter permease, partial [Dehalococcoidia bacterium]
MTQYLVQRVMLMIITLIGVTFLVFSLLRLIPGGVESAILGEQATPEQFEEIRRSLGLNKPIPQQYLTWIGDVLRGDLGESVVSKRSIGADMKARMPVTMELGLMAMMVSMLIAVPVGILAAVRQDTMGDYLARSFAIALLSIPGFWLGTLMITFGAR